MKKWTGILVSFLVLILLAYYILGFIVERTLNKNINAFHNTSVMSVHLNKYKRGWFSSKALLTLEMHIPEQKTTDKSGATSVNPPVDFDLSFPLIINHGPFIFTDAGIRFGLGHVTTRPQTHYNALITYFNNTLFKYTFPSFEMKGKAGPQDFQFEWKGIKALLKISPNVDKLTGKLVLYGFNGAASNVEFKIGKVTNKFKFTYSQGLWLGQTHFSIPSVTLNMGDTKTFDLKAFDLDLGSEIKGDLLDYNCNISLNKLFVEGKAYGPGSFILNIKNLDPKAMADINKFEWTMLENNQNPELNMLALLAELPKLLSKGSELELSEMLIVPEGKITGNLKITIPQINSIDPKQILQKVHGEGHFRAPIAVVKKLMLAKIQSAINNTPTQSTTAVPATTSSVTPAPINTNPDPQAQVDTLLQNYVNKGLLKIEGTDYVIQIKFDNQQIIVNETPFNPDMLK